MKRLLVIFLAIPLMLSAAISFHGNYQDHAVLQRDRPIEISGLATPGVEVQVAIEPTCTSYPVGKLQRSGVADESGEWKITVTLPAGGPLAITATAGEESVTISDILVGEVWLLTGQSNMELPLWGDTPFVRVDDGEYVRSQLSKLPQIRYFDTQHSLSLESEQTEPKGRWVAFHADEPTTISAVGYFFARQLYHDLQVPVGIIKGHWGGMLIRSFMSRDTLLKCRPELVDYADSMVKSYQSAEAKGQPIEEWAAEMKQYWEKLFLGSGNPADREAARGWESPDYDDSEWTFLAPMAAATFRKPDRAVAGVEWFRTTVQIPPEWAGKPLVLNLGTIDDVDFTYFNGVQVGAIGYGKKEYWAVPRIYPIPTELVKAGRAVIAIRVPNYDGGSGLFGPAGAWHLTMEGKPDKRLPLTNGWRYRQEGFLSVQVGSLILTVLTPQNPFHCPFLPMTIYNAMIAPWKRYGVRGELWYQGESDCGGERDYYQFQKAMVADRRTIWGDDYAFLWCQLSGYENHCPDNRGPEDFWKANDPNRNHPWIRFRDMQRLLLDVIPTSGMAVTIDHGDAYDIHPHRKEEVGFRLAKEAERICYGYQGVSAGPLYKSCEVVGNQMVLHFDNVGAGLASLDGRPLGCFAIAGEDGKYVWADATIVGDTVVLTSPEVPEPVKASYGAVTYDERLNFGNANGFPASPFFTAKPDWLK
ncbi:MAG: hypothetical protein IKO65_09865 [Victivallales bacterium]|nr:hypothetical protein [Victivallales bacterium]